jgi:hypothetical protein
MESRALYIAAERKIPDILAEAGEKGLAIQTLAEKTGIEYRKLGKLVMGIVKFGGLLIVSTKGAFCEPCAPSTFSKKWLRIDSPTIVSLQRWCRTRV